MNPAQGQEVMLVLEPKELLHVLHVAVVRAGRLFGHDDVGQHKLVVRLQNNNSGRHFAFC